MATDANLRGYAIKASFGVPRHSLSILVFFKVWMIKNRVVQLLSCVNLRHRTSKLVFWNATLVPSFIFQAHFVSQASFQETFGELFIDFRSLGSIGYRFLQTRLSLFRRCFDGFSPSPVVPTPTTLRRLVAFHGSGESCRSNFATI